MAEASIVFRNQDMSATGKIYVKTMGHAALLASKCREAAHWVDVIYRQDEVAYRWEDGEPHWDPGDLMIANNAVEPYFFDPGVDGDQAEMRDRMDALSEMLEYSFKVATGQEAAFHGQCSLDVVLEPDEDLWALITDAIEIAKAAPKDEEEWIMYILNWMKDPASSWVGYRVEYAALLIKSEIAIPGCQVAFLDPNPELRQEFQPH